MHEFRLVPGFSNYWVDKLGFIYSSKSGFFKKLKHGHHEDGYTKYNLSGGKRKVLTYISGHRAAALAWILNPENKPQVNHKNGLRTDNRIENLEWVTSSENNMHLCRVLGSRRGETNPNSKITEEMVRSIRKDTRTLHAIAKEYGIYFSTVHKIKHRESWAHVT